MPQLNARVRDLDMPPAIRSLPISAEGYPVPWFVAWMVDGKAQAKRSIGVPDFRVIHPDAMVQAHNKQRCWLCGQRRGVWGAFVVGSMCAINRVSSEPPSHLACAEYAVKACPFLTQPRMVRNTKNMLDDGYIAGIPIMRNPGVTAIWVTKSYRVMDTPGGVLFRLGEPHEVTWWREGRRATREEILASINSGLPVLEEAAKLDGDDALLELARMTGAAMQLVPA